MIAPISIILSLVSFLVVFFLFWKKIPVLVNLPEKKTKKIKHYVFHLKRKINNVPFVKNFSWQGILLKILSKIRVLVLKIEGKIALYLQKLRAKSKK